MLLGSLAWVGGLAPLPACLLGAVLALSSTALVAPLIAERHRTRSGHPLSILVQIWLAGMIP